jgi:hypothetical protein
MKSYVLYFPVQITALTVGYLLLTLLVIPDFVKAVILFALSQSVHDIWHDSQ